MTMMEIPATKEYMSISEIEKLERNDSKINLSIQLETVATKKLTIWAYSLGKYL